jgi:hypothetical protein
MALDVTRVTVLGGSRKRVATRDRRGVVTERYEVRWRALLRCGESRMFRQRFDRAADEDQFVSRLRAVGLPASGWHLDDDGRPNDETVMAALPTENPTATSVADARTSKRLSRPCCAPTSNSSAASRPTLACSPVPPAAISMSPTSSSGLGSAPASWQFPEGHRLRDVGRHAFRHLAVTRWLRAGVPLRTAARWGGWSDVATMLRWYESRLPGDDELAAGRLAARVGEHNSR